MNSQQLERISFLLRSQLEIPPELAMPLYAAIYEYLGDASRRSLDYHLELPPRRPHCFFGLTEQRDQIYCDLAASIDGSANLVAQIIIAKLEIWLSGDSEARSFDPGFVHFLRNFQELTPSHVKETQLRKIITPVKVGSE